MHHIGRWCLSVGIFLILLINPAQGQDEAPATDSPAEESPVASQETASQPAVPEARNRLIYVPFRDLQSVFNSDDANAIVPYAFYMQLLKSHAQKHQQSTDVSLDAIVTQATYTATVEEDVARTKVELTVNVLAQDKWARIPLEFGQAAVGSIKSSDDSNTFLKGTSEGAYELLVKGVGQRTITLELLAAIKTSPEARLFELDCPAIGINELQVTIPAGDQTVHIDPIEVLLPTEGSNESQTVVKAALGSIRKFTVRWFPKAGSRPQMDLLSSVTNDVTMHIESQLVQSTNVFTWEILRGEMQEAAIIVPTDCRIIDVVAHTGRIQSWDAEPAEGHQQVRLQLLTPVSDKLSIEVQTERDPAGESLQLLGRSEDNLLHSVHAANVIRESGRLTVTSDDSLTVLPQTQSGIRRASSDDPKSRQGSAWDFSGQRGTLIVQVKPVEPRLLANQHSRVTFTDDELQLMTHIDFVVERAGVFELKLKYPDSLTIDTVRADGMSEFNVDQNDRLITLALTNRRMGAIGVDIRGHQAFDSTAAQTETAIPSIEPQGVERSTGGLAVVAPQFLDVVTIDEQTTGLTPSREASNRANVTAWSFSHQPWTLSVRTSPRPAQVEAIVATTAKVEPELVEFNSEIRFEIRNAGINTLRVAVPEAIADSVRFRSISSGHTIQQRSKAATAEEGWVTWTLVLQSEVTGTVQIGADWELDLPSSEETTARSFVAEPLRVLPPYPDGEDQKRRVTLTQVKGELRLLRHESLSISAEPAGETTESIDVRELELLPRNGYLAFRYFVQPASASVTVEQHEIHEVVATVVSRAAVEVVTEKQSLASYRCRYQITTSERQRLRVDVPAGSDLQTPTLNNRRTTFEPAGDVESAEGCDVYYINISREGTSDQKFLLSFQLQCPIAGPDRFPYEGQGGRQLLRIPEIGDSTGNTVVQETRVGIWTPADISIVGKPENWTPLGRQTWSLLQPLKATTTANANSLLNEWIGTDSSASDFAYQGNVTILRALGSGTAIEASWWRRPFLVAIISGALICIGLVLRKSPWENRITLILLALVAVSIWHLYDTHAATQMISAGSIGMLGIVGIWATSLFFGQATQTPPPKPDGPDTDDGRKTPEPHQPDEPPGTVTPAPGVKEIMNELMGGK
jgi:hypothetical protein